MVNTFSSKIIQKYQTMEFGGIKHVPCTRYLREEQ